MGEELFEIVAHEVTVEVKDENTGEVFRRELPIDFYDELEISVSAKDEYRCNRHYIRNSQDNSIIKMIRILKEPKNALIKQYRKLFSYDGVKLSFEDDALDAIADLAVERKTGARGLRSIMEKAMMDVMYTIPSDNTIKECVITKACVLDGASPLTIRERPEINTIDLLEAN